LNLEDYKSVQRWITKLGKKSGSPNTRRVFLHFLEEFCKHAKLSPDELIAERTQDQKSPDKFVQKRAEDRLDEWFTELEKKRLSRNTCVLAYNAVRSFYKANYSELEIEDPPASWVTKSKPGLTREELKAMLDHTDNLMHKAYILCQTQSGLSVSDLLKLTVNDLKDEIEGYIHLRLVREKEKQLGFFDTFFGKTATAALKEYFKTRKNLKPSSPVFPCTQQNISYFLAKISDRAGVTFRVSSHDLRKYFNTQLKMARVDSPAFNDTLIEYWMGHSLGKVKGAYFIPSVEEQLRLYKLASQYLSSL